jgi:hypothetical protein
MANWKRFVKRITGLAPLWPNPPYDENLQPHFLFIITPPYSGSTALAALINSSHRTMFLQHRAEGQWLIPGLCQDRWDPNKTVKWHSVKATWLSQYQKINQLVGDVDVVIEKSPPNMVRIQQLTSLFDRFSLLAFNRNPYASCSSLMYRLHHPENKTPEQRLQILDRIARDWIERSDIIKKLVLELNINLFTYEEFCDDLPRCVQKIDLPPDALQTIDCDSIVKVKDYQPQKIISQNQRQIVNLTESEIQLLTDRFTDRADVLSFFNYKPSIGEVR